MENPNDNDRKMVKESRKRKNETGIDSEDDIPKSKNRSYNKAAQKEDEQLTKILFGSTTTFLKNLEEAEAEDIKYQPDSGLGEDESSGDEEMAPAWVDEDDDGMEVGQALDSQNRTLPDGGTNSRSNKYKDLLKYKFESMYKTPKWVTCSKQVDSDDDNDEILQSCGFIKNQQSSYLPGSVLEFKKMKDLNCETYSEGPYINVIEFFNNSSVALVGGQSGTATFFAVDGKKNAKLHSVGFEKYPILSAKLIENNNEAIFGSRHPHIYSYDLIAAKPTKIALPPDLTTFKNFIVSPDQKLIAVEGKWGEIHLLTANSKERIGSIKQSNNVTSLCFSPNGNHLYAHSDSGEITIFDINTRRVKHKFVDEGCLQGTTIRISSTNQFLATGSAQGVVNLYDINSVFESTNPTPRKTLMNLTTSITSLEFNPTSEILAFFSVDVMNSVKFYHVNSSSVFKNFPQFQTKFGNINVMNFSPGSGYVALGNKKSTVSLFRLNHFKNY